MAFGKFNFGLTLSAVCFNQAEFSCSQVGECVLHLNKSLLDPYYVYNIMSFRNECLRFIMVCTKAF